MATIKQGIVGGFSGSVGPVVGYQWRGRWCVRSRGSEPRNPRTERQQEHRMMFREEVRLASRLNWLLRESMERLSLAEGLTPCNYFIRENQAAFGWSEGRLTVDWSRLVLSHGPVAPVAFGVPEVTDGTRLSVTFEKNPLHVRADAFDKVYLYLYCTDRDEGYMVAPVYRHERRISVLLPASWAGKEVQLYGLVADCRGRWSETLYIGYGPLEESEGPAGEQGADGETALPGRAGATVVEHECAVDGESAGGAACPLVPD